MLFKTRPNGAHPGSGRAPLVDNEGRQIVILESSTSGESGITVGRIANPSANFTRPNDTTAYAVGDLIANSTTAGSVTPMSFANIARVAAGAASIIKARLSKTGTGITGAAFTLHLYGSSPTVTNGDNGAWLSNQAATYLGSFEFGLARAKVFSDGVSINGITETGYPVTVDLASGTTIYGLLEARGAYAPTAQEVFTVTLEVEQE